MTTKFLEGNAPCPCGSGASYSNCCGPLHDGISHAMTAQQLMRSRYSAFALGNTKYLMATIAPEKAAGFDLAEFEKDQTKWIGLEIISCVKGSVLDQKGTVEFKASFQNGSRQGILHENSRFERRGGKWLYVDGDFEDHAASAHLDTIRSEKTKTPSGIGRNSPCPCGSGRKFKQCCGK